MKRQESCQFCLVRRPPFSLFPPSVRPRGARKTRDAPARTTHYSGSSVPTTARARTGGHPAAALLPEWSFCGVHAFGAALRQPWDRSVVESKISVQPRDRSVVTLVLVLFLPKSFSPRISSIPPYSSGEMIWRAFGWVLPSSSFSSIGPDRLVGDEEELPESV